MRSSLITRVLARGEYCGIRKLCGRQSVLTPVVEQLLTSGTSSEATAVSFAKVVPKVQEAEQHSNDPPRVAAVTTEEAPGA